jgi:hypothetical protein
LFRERIDANAFVPVALNDCLASEVTRVTVIDSPVVAKQADTCLDIMETSQAAHCPDVMSTYIGIPLSVKASMFTMSSRRSRLREQQKREQDAVLATSLNAQRQSLEKQFQEELQRVKSQVRQEIQSGTGQTGKGPSKARTEDDAGAAVDTETDTEQCQENDVKCLQTFHQRELAKRKASSSSKSDRSSADSKESKSWWSIVSGLIAPASITLVLATVMFCVFQLWQWYKEYSQQMVKKITVSATPIPVRAQTAFASLQSPQTTSTFAPPSFASVSSPFQPQNLQYPQTPVNLVNPFQANSDLSQRRPQVFHSGRRQ